MNIDIAKLKSFKKILVTGPQRSGTTIAGHILAKELDYKYYDERDVGVRSLSQLFDKLMSKESLVVQGPCFCSIVQWVDSPETAIVIMKRNIEEIVESEAKINWSEEKKELQNYYKDDGIISVARYKTWEKYQKPNMKVPYFELNYSSLKNHPMWIEKEARKNFRREISPPSSGAIQKKNS